MTLKAMEASLNECLEKCQRSSAELMGIWDHIIQLKAAILDIAHEPSTMSQEVKEAQS